MLKNLLDLIYRQIALSHIKKNITKTAIEQYKILKKKFGLHTITTYRFFYRQIFKCSINNHKNLQGNGKAVTKTKNKVVELGNSLLEQAVIYAFLDGFNTSYQT